MLDQVIIKTVEGMIGRPLMNRVPIDAFVLDLKVRPGPMELWNPLVREQSDVRLAHDELAQAV